MMGWWQGLRGLGLLAIAATVGVNEKAIAQTWTEVDVLPSQSVGSDARLPDRYRPIPPEYVQLGEQLQALRNRWQSSQLTQQALDPEGDKATLDKSSFSRKLQRHIDVYHYFLEAREFPLADQQARSIFRLVGDQYQQQKPRDEAEIRAIWLDRGAIINAQNEAGLAKLFDQFQAMGINVVFLETVNASYPIYPSQVAPEQNPLLVGWDPLKSAVTLAHARNMELHAWTWIFAAANQRHNELMGQPQYYLGPVLSKHPDWGTGDRRGDPFHARSRKAFFDPANPEVRQYLLDLLSEIATKYDVDGIQLDYIRYPFQEIRRNEVYGFGEAAREQFRRLGYPDPMTMAIADPHWRDWQNFRVEQVDQFVAQASATLRQKRPDLILSAAVFPMARDRRLDQIQQNWEAWLEAGHIDLLVPMTYAETSPELTQLTDDLLATFPTTKTLLVPSVRLLDIDAGAALDQRQLIRQLPTVGTAFFAASNLNSALSQDLSSSSTVSPLRDPLGAIAVRFGILQQEWALSFPTSPWQTAASTFAQALETARRQPNAKNLLLTHSQWADFITEISPHLQQYGKEDPYQAQVWENRLASIEQLLTYGDRRLSFVP